MSLMYYLPPILFPGISMRNYAEQPVLRTVASPVRKSYGCLASRRDHSQPGLALSVANLPVCFEMVHEDMWWRFESSDVTCVVGIDGICSELHLRDLLRCFFHPRQALSQIVTASRWNSQISKLLIRYLMSTKIQSFLAPDGSIEWVPMVIPYL